MRYRNLLTALLTFCMLIAVCSYAQNASLNTIKGNVTDAETGGSIEGVNVYLANTSIGTSTDRSGEYELNTAASGEYNIVYSIVGYQRKVFTIRLKNSSSVRHNVALSPQVIEMQEVEVVSSNKAWKKNYEFFVKEFIGDTDFAKQTSIENPWVLDFEDGKGNSLFASAQEPLIIENLALGYRLHLELVEFYWNRSGHGGAYQIFPRYEELSTENELQKRIWSINRLKTYYGSLPHFLASLYHDRIEEEHFDISKKRNIKPLSKGETKFELIGKPGLSSEKRKHLKGYKIDRPTQVSFRHTIQIQLQSSTLKIPIRKESEISANTKNELFFVHQSGALLYPTSLKLFGVWAKNRVANSLPTNYVPDS